MSDAPCGCEQYADAQSARDGRTREALLQVAGQSADRWRCPRSGAEQGALDQATAAIASEVEALTGCARGAITTCPHHIASGADVIRALRLYRAQQSGGVSFDDDPPAVIVSASEVVGASDARRLEKEQEDRERDRGR